MSATVHDQQRIERYLPATARTDTCWPWSGALDTCGYGLLRVNGRTWGAHRWLYQLIMGPIPKGLELDHLCRMRHCVNPAHLEPVTHAENMRRSGPFSPKAALTHCRNGHEFTPENTYIRPHGWRDCRTCIRKRVRAYQARKAQRAAEGIESR